MALHGRTRGRIEPDQTQALSHPVRISILELFTRERGRSLKAESLAEDLAPDFPKLTIAQIAYHVARLKDAQLLPVR